MKILSLTFENINSLKGKHHIDFTDEAFVNNPLFAITGPTGSGKTTVLDVISLALFNEVPRLGKISNTEIEEKGAILTRNQEEGFAEVHYVCARGEFVSTWSISTNRNGNLRPYEMELFRMRPERESLDLKKSEVPAKNEALIGLRYSQFIKSVLLAQGEFAEFLKADKKTRSQLLEQITDTGIYRELGMKAYRKYSDKNKAIEKEEHHLEQLQNELLPDEKVDELNREKNRLTDLIFRKEKAYDRLKKQLDLAEEIRKLNGLISTKKEILTKTTKEKQHFLKRYGERLKTHEAIRGFSTSIEAYDHERKRVTEQKEEVEKLTKKYERAENAQAQKKKDIETFIGQELTRENLIGALREFFEKIDSLQNERDVLRSKYNEKKGLLTRELEGVTDFFRGKTPLVIKHNWSSIITRVQTDKNDLLKKVGKMPSDFDQALQNIETTIERLWNAQTDHRDIKRLTKDIDKLKKEQTEIANAKEEFPKAIEIQTVQKDNDDLKLKNLRQTRENQLIRAELDDLREQLRPHQACPLCGSTEHPYATEKPQNSDLGKAIAQQEKECEVSRKKLSQLLATDENLKDQQTKIIDELRLKTDERKRLDDRFSDAYSEEIKNQCDDFETAVSIHKQRLSDLKALREVHEKARSLDKAKPILDELLSVFKEGKKVKQEIEGLYQGQQLQKDVRRLENNWRDSLKNRHFIEERLNELRPKLKDHRTTLNDIKTNLRPQLEALGFKSIMSAKKALIDPEQYKAVIDQKTILEKKITTVTTEVETLTDQKAAKEEYIDNTGSLEELHRKKEEYEHALNRLKEHLNEHKRLLTNHFEWVKKYTRKQKAIKEEQNQNRRWKLLNKLIGDAKGDKFNQFAQDLTLRHLLKLANKRLKGLSDRYRLALDLEHKAGLEIIDLDMGGQRRSVRTLSGGESFLMSLSLALALSDLASKNVTINSLFVDEGFGTLDPETLDQTLDTLERLQTSSSKTIGIISHVESLKERIGTQIQLQRDGRGYSTLTLKSV